MNSFGKLKDQFNFETYIKKVLKQLHNELSLSLNAKSQVNFFLNEIGSAITRQAMIALKSSGKIKRSSYDGKTTLTSREIMNAVRIMIPNELSKHAISEGSKAIAKFQSNIDVNKRSKKKRNVKLMRKAEKASLMFPPSLVRHLMEFTARPWRISETASIFLTAVLEYLCAELLELSGNYTKDVKQQRISARALFYAIGSDEELKELFHKLNIVVVGGGVFPNIHMRLLKSPEKRKNKFGISNSFGAGRGRKSNKRVVRRVLRDNIQGITNPAITRIARRAGVKRLSGMIYEEIRGILLHYMRPFIKNIVLFADVNRRKTISEDDVYHAMGQSLTTPKMYAEGLNSFGRKKTGTLALQEIRKYQKTTELLIPKEPFQRLVREVAQDYKADLRFSEQALLLIQRECEHYLINLLSKAQLVAIRADTITVSPTDLLLVRRIIGERS